MNFREKLMRYFFAREVEAIEVAADAEHAYAEDILEQAREALEEAKKVKTERENLRIIDVSTRQDRINKLLRAQLGGISPEVFKDQYEYDSKTQSGSYVLPDALYSLISEENPNGDEVMSQKDFLAEMKRIRDGKAFQRLIEFLIRDQVMYTAKESPDHEAANFGRATINGLSLVREEVERYANMFVEAVKPDDTDFDPHEAL